MEEKIIKSGEWGTCLWGIDETGFLVIGAGVGESLEGPQGTPWEEFRKMITSISVEGSIRMPESSSLKGMFRNCENLEQVKLNGLDTSKVVDMSYMFENCSKLKTLDLSFFNTVAADDMGRMFAGCRELANLDLSSFDTTRVRNMRGMFAKCNKLHSLILGTEFNVTGNGRTDCGNLSIRETGTYRVAKVINVKGGIVTYHENRGSMDKFERATLADFNYVIEENPFEAPEGDYKFFGWCTDKEGEGDFFEPGQEFTAVDDDLDLYAIWICPPVISTVEPMAGISYGNPLAFVLPEIVSDKDSSLIGYLEISPDGKDDTWTPIKRDAILPASCDGWLVRLRATNKCGSSVSNAVEIKIKKAGVDLSKVRWAESPDMTYDGTEKSVWLEGLPEGVKAVYFNNTAMEAGNHIASVTLDYDKENYDIPFKIRDYEWSIKKARFDMSEAKWNYSGAYEYDGKAKIVEIIGLPDGVVAEYVGNNSVVAGVMTATASFKYDAVNYEEPDAVAPCVWEIKRKELNANDFKWSSYDDFVYDGTRKSVSIINLPDDAEVKYSGNEEKMAGKYLARAEINGNYFINGSAECEWEIRRAKIDLKNVKWNYSEPFIYDRQLHEVYLTGIPNGVVVRYNDNIGTDAGDYEARATFSCSDSHNFFTPTDMTLTWSIKKAAKDMRNVRWDYDAAFVYDGKVKTVNLINLPDGVYAVIENGEAANVGVYNAHAVLKYNDNNYEVETIADCQWQIKKARFDMSSTYWNYTSPFTYDGEAKSVTLESVPQGLDVEYQNNIKLESGKYVATAKLTPIDSYNYETPEINACTWAINKSVLDRIDIAWDDDSDFVYDGKTKTVHICSEINDKIRVEYTGDTAVDAGEHETIANFFPVDTRNYEAPEAVQHKWLIKKGDMEIGDAVWNYNSAFTYDGNKKTVELVNLPKGVIVHYENNTGIEVGEYVATASFELMNPNNYNELAPISFKWSIQKATYDLSKTAWQENRSFGYDGTSKTVELTGLPYGINPIYFGNENQTTGEYVATVEFEYDTHNYEKPTFEPCNWNIVKSPFIIDGATWEYDSAFVYDGSEKSVKVINLPAGAELKYYNAAATNAGIYSATADVIADDDINFENNSMETLVWKIVKGNYDMSAVYWDYDQAIKYDGTEKTIVLKGLPEGVTPTYFGNQGTEVGGYCASVSFTVADPDNYNIPEFNNCNWEIAKGDIDMTGVRWNYSRALTYNGRMQEITLTGLPAGIRAIYSGNCETAVGKYTASVELIIYDTSNYNTPVIDDCNWEIIKADYNMSSVRWDYTDAKVFNGRKQGVYLDNIPNGITVTYEDNEGIDIGRYTAKVKLAVADPENYNIPTVYSCDWEIVPAHVNISDVRWDFIPEAFVFDGEKKEVSLRNLPKMLDVKYSGNTATEAGHYTAVATFSVHSANYIAPESITCDWYINKAGIDMGQINWNYTEEFTFDGKLHGIELKGLPDGVRVEYENNKAINAGTYEAIAKLTSDNYDVPNSIGCTWVVNRANCDISGIRWDYDQAYTYDGREKTVKLAGLPSTLSVTYSDNAATQTGTYYASAEFTHVDPDNYIAPEKMIFEWCIAKADYDMSHTTWTLDRTFTYDGGIKQIELKGYPTAIKPVYNDAQAIEAGTYNATVQFEYDSINYNEPSAAGCKWEIKKNNYDLSQTYWDYEEAFIYDGDSKSVELKNLPDGLIPRYVNNSNINSGEYFAEVSFEYDEANYNEPKFSGCKWKIDLAEVPVNEDKLRWNYNQPFTYDGKAKLIGLAEHSEKVVHEEQSGFINKLFGRKTDESTVVKPEVRLCGIPEGFEAIYEENEHIEVGTYYAKAILKHKTNANYKEYVVPGCRWEIKKAKLDMSNVRWDYDQAFVYDGDYKTISLVGVPEQLVVTYSGNSAVVAGMYEAKANFELLDTRNYEMPRPVQGCMWKIDKAQYDMSEARWTNYEDLFYSGKEKTIRVVGLPEGVKVEAYSGNKATDAGVYTANVTFRYKNAENYEAPEMKPLRWKINKKQINTDSIEWNYNESTMFVYDEQIKEVKLIGVPNGMEVVYINNNKIDAGSYVAKAKLIYDTKNYEAPEIPDCIWKIAKANLDVADVHWSYEQPFKYDGETKKISLKNLPGKISVRYMDNMATEIGSYKAKAYLTYNTDNYNPPAIETSIDWEIVR